MSRGSNLKRSRGAGVYDAFRELVFMEGPAGVEKLAVFMGMRTGTLYNKADSTDESHNQPTIRDLIQATHFRSDFRALDALEEQFGRAAFDCSRFEDISDEALLDMVLHLGKEHGEFHQAMSRALQGQLTVAALQDVRAEAFDVVSSLMSLVARMEGLLPDGEPGERGERP